MISGGFLGSSSSHEYLVEIGGIVFTEWSEEFFDSVLELECDHLLDFSGVIFAAGCCKVNRVFSRC